MGFGIWDLRIEISLSSLQNTGFGIRDFRSGLFVSLQGAGFGIWDAR